MFIFFKLISFVCYVGAYILRNEQTSSRIYTRQLSCPNDGIICAQPLSYKETRQFECNDHCPEGYLCCDDSCFQHKICKQAVTDNNELEPDEKCPVETLSCQQPFPSHMYRSLACEDGKCPLNYKCCPDSCFYFKVCKQIDLVQDQDDKNNQVSTTPTESSIFTTTTTTTTTTEENNRETTTDGGDNDDDTGDDDYDGSSGDDDIISQTSTLLHTTNTNSATTTVTFTTTSPSTNNKNSNDDYEEDNNTSTTTAVTTTTQTQTANNETDYDYGDGSGETDDEIDDYDQETITSLSSTTNQVLNTINKSNTDDMIHSSTENVYQNNTFTTTQGYTTIHHEEGSGEINSGDDTEEDEGSGDEIVDNITTVEYSTSDGSTNNVDIDFNEEDRSTTTLETNTIINKSNTDDMIHSSTKNIYENNTNIISNIITTPFQNNTFTTTQGYITIHHEEGSGEINSGDDTKEDKGSGDEIVDNITTVEYSTSDGSINNVDIDFNEEDRSTTILETTKENKNSDNEEITLSTYSEILWMNTTLTNEGTERINDETITHKSTSLKSDEILVNILTTLKPSYAQILKKSSPLRTATVTPVAFLATPNKDQDEDNYENGSGYNNNETITMLISANLLKSETSTPTTSSTTVSESNISVAIYQEEGSGHTNSEDKSESEVSTTVFKNVTVAETSSNSDTNTVDIDFNKQDSTTTTSNTKTELTHDDELINSGDESPEYDDDSEIENSGNRAVDSDE